MPAPRTPPSFRTMGLGAQVEQVRREDLPEPFRSSVRMSAALSRQRRTLAISCRPSTEALGAGSGGLRSSAWRNWESSPRSLGSSLPEKAPLFSRIES